MRKFIAVSLFLALLSLAAIVFQHEEGETSLPKQHFSPNGVGSFFFLRGFSFRDVNDTTTIPTTTATIPDTTTTTVATTTTTTPAPTTTTTPAPTTTTTAATSPSDTPATNATTATTIPTTTTPAPTTTPASTTYFISPSGASVFENCTNNNNNRCSLETVISGIQASPAANTQRHRLVLDAGTYSFQQTVSVSSVHVEVVGAAGTSGVSTVLDGSWNAPLLLLNGGNTSMSFSRVRFSRGGNANALGTAGTAVQISNGAVVTFDSCEFVNNVGVVGGAVRIDNSSVVSFTSTLFQNNTAFDGGVWGSEFDFALAYGMHGDTGGIGGAVAVVRSFVTFANCSFVSNVAKGDLQNPAQFDLGGMGGSLFVFGQGLNSSQVSISNSVFQDNGANGIVTPINGIYMMGGMGGALHVCDAKVDVSSTVFRKNYATGSGWTYGGSDGGAVFVRSTLGPSNVLVTFTDTTFDANVAYGTSAPNSNLVSVLAPNGGEGAAVMVLRSSAKFVRCLFIANANMGGYPALSTPASGPGHSTVSVATTAISTGDVHYATASFDACVFKNNVANSDGKAPFAAAIAAQSAEVTITNSIFDSNGLHTTIDPLFASQQQKANGGAISIYTYNSTYQAKQCTIDNTIFRYNFVSNGNQPGCGGAIAISDGTLVITKSVFEYNTAGGGDYSGGYGGAICVDPSSTTSVAVTVTDTTFVGNKANAPLAVNGTGFGGAIAVLSSAGFVMAADCTFQDNAISTMASIDSFSVTSMESKWCSNVPNAQNYDPFNKIQTINPESIDSTCTLICDGAVCDSTYPCLWNEAKESCNLVTTLNIQQLAKQNIPLLIFAGCVLGAFITVVVLIACCVYKAKMKNGRAGFADRMLELERLK